MRSEEEKCFPQPDRFPGHSDRNAPGTGTTAYGTSGSGSFSSPKYKDVVYLYYYKGYSAEEISRILKKNVNTVYTLLTRARKILKKELEEVTDIE